MTPTCSNSIPIRTPLNDPEINAIPMDVWSSILSGKDSNSDLYIHPMSKKRSLSDESLEICTESLGSETGSDKFSSSDEFGSDPPRSSTTTTAPRRKHIGHSKRPALPPPLPSHSLQIRRRRQDGRLVMEAVEMAPFESCFRAERRDNRLLLTFSDHGDAVADREDDVDDRGGDVAVEDDEVAEVTTAGVMSDSKPHVYEYLRKKLQPCKRSLIIMLKETTTNALPILK